MSLIKYMLKYKGQAVGAIFNAASVSMVFWWIINHLIANVELGPTPDMTIAERSQYLAEVAGKLAFLYNFRIFGAIAIAIILYLPILYMRIRIHEKEDPFIECRNIKKKEGKTEKDAG